MGVCDSKNNSIKKEPPKQDKDIKSESTIKNNNLPSSITNVTKSLCKVVAPNITSSGFFIQLFKGEQDFYCLMVNEHVINKTIIEQKEEIYIYYNNESSIREIQLNSEERFIKDFKDINMDATIIEILPNDNIRKDYFLLPFIDDNNKLIDKDITIIQYLKGELNHSYGKIKNIIRQAKYEFAYEANIKEGLSGIPIFLKGTSRVIGISKGYDELKKEKLGDFIWPIFCYFKNYSGNKNEMEKISYGNNNNFITNINDKNIKLDQMTIYYEIPKSRLFGNKFVINNINNCYLLIDDQQIEICDKIKLNNEQKEKNILKIKLIEKKVITNMSHMFFDCNSLYYISDISKWDTKNVTNMSHMFSECISLYNLPDISKWDTKNVTNMSYMFFYCSSLIYLPDISKWVTKNVTDMSYMFYNCESLNKLPDISGWNSDNVINMSWMFYNCNSLKSLPDISGWKINKALKKDYIFLSCPEKIIPGKFK